MGDEHFQPLLAFPQRVLRCAAGRVAGFHQAAGGDDFINLGRPGRGLAAGHQIGHRPAQAAAGQFAADKADQGGADQGGDQQRGRRVKQGLIGLGRNVDHDGPGRKGRLGDEATGLFLIAGACRRAVAGDHAAGAIEDGEDPVGGQGDPLDALLEFAGFHGGEQQITDLAGAHDRHRDGDQVLLGQRPEDDVADRGLATGEGLLRGGIGVGMGQCGQRCGKRRAGVEQHVQAGVGQDYMAAETALESLRLLIQLPPTRRVIHQRRCGQHLQAVDPGEQPLVKGEGDVGHQIFCFAVLFAEHQVDPRPCHID